MFVERSDDSMDLERPNDFCCVCHRLCFDSVAIRVSLGLGDFPLGMQYLLDSSQSHR